MMDKVNTGDTVYFISGNAIYTGVVQDTVYYGPDKYCRIRNLKNRCFGTVDKSFISEKYLYKSVSALIRSLTSDIIDCEAGPVELRFSDAIVGK